MSEHFLKLRYNWRVWMLLTVLLIDVGIWYAVKTESAVNTVTIAFLDVGQGDAIYIESPTRNQIMIDGGPSRILMSEIARVTPFYDKSIDTLIVTNPDADHYSGFIDMVQNFNITRVIESGTQTDTERYKLFEQELREKNIERVLAKRGMVMDLGGGLELHIFYPDKDVSDTERNEGSIIAELVYGETEIMLTGDAPNSTLEYVADLNQQQIDSDILKVGHHGSRTSASEIFATLVSPEYAIISAGRENRYGHPHAETTELYKKLNVPVLGTYQEGTIIFTTDGKNLVRKI
jgi:competence protein ComEC